MGLVRSSIGEHGTREGDLWFLKGLEAGLDARFRVITLETCSSVTGDVSTGIADASHRFPWCFAGKPSDPSLSLELVQTDWVTDLGTGASLETPNG